MCVQQKAMFSYYLYYYFNIFIFRIANEHQKESISCNILIYIQHHLLKVKVHE